MEKYKEIESIVDSSCVKYKEEMKKHTTMKVGGVADVLVEPTSKQDIINVIKFAKKNNIKYYLLGKGSNMVVADEGIDGIVIMISSKFSSIKVAGNEIIASAGASMPLVAIEAKKNSLTGFEFACGIPGTIGGGIKMNAGAYGGEIADIVSEITYLDENCNILKINKDEAKFGYRDSIFKRNDKLVILEARFSLKKGDISEISKKMEENNLSRRTKQPIDMPNSGSVFKRPEGHYVGPMIIDCGLQGFSIGGAQVSKKHAGFIVNTGDATCKDIKELISLIQQKVEEKFSVKLETEIQFIGGNS